MAVNKKQIELDRIVNMLRSFGWDVRTSSFDGDKVTVTFEKTVKEGD